MLHSLCMYEIHLWHLLAQASLHACVCVCVHSTNTYEN